MVPRPINVWAMLIMSTRRLTKYALNVVYATGIIRPKPVPCRMLKAKSNCSTDVTKMVITLPKKYNDAPPTPTLRIENLRNNVLVTSPAKLNALKKLQVIRAMALVSSPKLVRKSPNIRPNDGMLPNAQIYKPKSTRNGTKKREKNKRKLGSIVHCLLTIYHTDRHKTSCGTQFECVFLCRQQTEIANAIKKPSQI